MAWYSVVLKTAFITPNFHVRLNVRSYLLRFPIQAAINELHIQYLVTLCDLVAFVEKNLKRNRVVLCHAVQVDYTVGIPNFSNRANLIIEVCLTFRGHFWCFLFLTGIGLWWNPAMLGHALFSGCWIFTDSDLLTRTNMVENGGLCWTERLLTHNVKCHWFWFFSF